MPLRQPPAEQPFSLIPPKRNPVSNDRVLLLLGLNHSAQPDEYLHRSPRLSRQSGQDEAVKLSQSNNAHHQTVRTTEFVTLTVTIFVV